MNRPWATLASFIVFSLLLLISLILISNASQNSNEFSQIYGALLIINGVGLIIFIIAIALNIRRLIRDLRTNIPGARLTLRMLLIFVGLSVTPVLVVYGFSVDFLRRGIDSWFDLNVSQALEDSMELSRTALDKRMRDLLRQTEQAAFELSNNGNQNSLLHFNATPSALGPVDLDALRIQLHADEAVLLGRNGSIIAWSSSAHDVVPVLPNEAILLQLRQGHNFVGLNPTGDTGLAVQVVVDVPDEGNNDRILQVLYPIAARVGQLASNVQSAYADYKRLAYLRDKLQLSFTMTLTLVLLFTIFSAVWMAFYSAKRLAEPIRDLAEGTLSVAQGDYSRALTVTSQDDIGVLVQSFNQMTRKIAQARDEARHSRDQVESQRAYLEAILSRLSSGVLALDTQQRLRTANPSASKILGLELQPLIGWSMDEICEQHSYLAAFCETVSKLIEDHRSDWRQQIELFGGSGRQVLMCRGTTFTETGPNETGHVVVFDDITALLQGQRDAAWSEVARRLAHEIKNPLTPIQLSAERLRHKYLPVLPATETGTLERLTNTIIQQVDTLKGMVNAFSEYARMPQMQTERLLINPFLLEVLDLYRNLDRQATIETSFEADLPAIEGDPGRLRQVLNNLIKNAFEATADNAPPYLKVTTRTTRDVGQQYVELRIEDHGPGIPEALLGKIFEPYVTSKPKGTGLGLAIVKKIIEEHGGIVWIENNYGPGACVVIRLPLGMRNAMLESLPTTYRQAI